MGDQVGKDVRRAAIEDQVLPVLGEQFHRSLQLQFEILEGGHLREFVPFLFTWTTSEIVSLCMASFEGAGQPEVKMDPGPPSACQAPSAVFGAMGASSRVPRCIASVTSGTVRSPPPSRNSSRAFTYCIIP